VDRATPTPRAKQPLAPALAQLADRLSDRLETRVSVELGRRRGKVVIQFGSVDDLERIAGLLGVSAGPDQQEDHSPEHEHESPEHEHGYNDHGSNYEE
jgi:ParB family transcriptional regulator, chromosome partitioning protein